ncbi:restriction endonuclease subunit S [Pseudoalteromonas distincta]|nr:MULTISPECIES: restriction endonuclease subunit S [Pseudoalteromonas]MDC3212458.1 restriction endonuclease subunit S [Pseudoalteromonas distincta]MDN3384789.1 restriction endonuclease subunit S [Pseudoalteromonas sp. APC 3358]
MGWSISKMSEVTNIISGGTPKSGISDYWFGDVKWITPKDMGKITGIYVSETGRNITQLGLDKSSAKLIPENSVILSTRAPIGYLAINTVPMATNQGCRGLVPKNTLDTKFLYYFLLKSVSLLNDLGSGTTFKELSKTALERVEIPHPEITEQKHIVAILEQAFADIEQARAKTEQNLKNARELFESYLQQVFSERGEGWRASKLKEITSKIGSGSTPRGGRASYKSEGISLIRSMNVHDRRFKNKDLAFIDDQQADKLSNVVVENNDVLLNITGASVARCCLAPEEYLPARVNQHVSIIRADRTVISPAFLNFVLTSKYYKDQLLGIGEAGSTRQAITKTQIEEFEVSYPENLEDQQNLLSSLYSLEEKTNDIQRIYRKKLLDLDELKKSILQKAFSGELTKTLEVDTNKGAMA